MKEKIICHGNDAGEVWTVELHADDRMVASASGFESAARARQAGDVLRAAILTDWRLNRQIETEEVDQVIQGWDGIPAPEITEDMGEDEIEAVQQVCARQMARAALWASTKFIARLVATSKEQ